MAFINVTGTHQKDDKGLSFLRAKKNLSIQWKYCIVCIRLNAFGLMKSKGTL